jgi:excisionase family DNA binding protein
MHDVGAPAPFEPHYGLRPLLVSVEQAAALLALGRTSIYQLINDGEIEPVKIGRSVRFVVAELEQFVGQRQAARCSRARRANPKGSRSETDAVGNAGELDDA